MSLTRICALRAGRSQCTGGGQATGLPAVRPVPPILFAGMGGFSCENRPESGGTDLTFIRWEYTYGPGVRLFLTIAKLGGSSWPRNPYPNNRRTHRDGPRNNSALLPAASGSPIGLNHIETDDGPKTFRSITVTHSRYQDRTTRDRKDTEATNRVTSQL